MVYAGRGRAIGSFVRIVCESGGLFSPREGPFEAGKRYSRLNEIQAGMRMGNVKINCTPSPTGTS